MKKIKIILFVLLCSLVISSFSFACATEDIFYYQYDNPVFEQARKAEIEGNHDIYFLKQVMNRYMEWEDIDESKIYADYDRIYCEYDWTPTKALEFLKAEDKAAFLKTMTPKYYFFHLYYDDELVSRCYPVYEPYKDTYASVADDRAGMDLFHNYYDKELLKQVIIDEGFEEYEPIFVIRLNGLWFSIVEKEGIDYLLYLPSFHRSVDAYVDAIKPYQDLYDQKLMTAEEAEPLLQLLDDRFSGKMEIESDEGNTGGGVANQDQVSTEDVTNEKQEQVSVEDVTNEQQETTVEEETVTPPSSKESEQFQDFDEEQYPKGQPLLWVIGGAVVLIGGLVMVLLIVKKRQAK